MGSIPQKGFLPSEKKDFLRGDNLHRTTALAQYSKRPIEDISASLALYLKTRRMQLPLSDFDPGVRGALYSDPDSWVALRRLREFCISVFLKWI